jgi:hypothetical protein
MEQDVCFFAMNGNIGRTALSDWVGRSGDVLLLLVFGIRLMRVGLHGSRSSKVRIRDRQSRVLRPFSHLLVHIRDDDLLASGGICDGLLVGRLRLHLILVRLDFSSASLVLCVLPLFVDLCVALRLVLVQTLHELVDGGDFVLAGVVTTGGPMGLLRDLRHGGLCLKRRVVNSEYVLAVPEA